jgi:hypothetical protein
VVVTAAEVGSISRTVKPGVVSEQARPTRRALAATGVGLGVGLSVFCTTAVPVELAPLRLGEGVLADEQPTTSTAAATHQNHQ